MVIDTIETDEHGEEIFSQRQNLAFKVRRVWTLDVEVGPEEVDRRRQADRANDTLIYVSFLRQVQKARQDSCR